jgi:hypothetical protein
MGLEIIFGWYLFLGTVCVLLEKMTKCFSRLSIFTVFIYSFLIKHGVTVPFNAQVNAEQMGLQLPPDAIDRWMISLVMMYACFVVGVMIAKRLFGKKQLTDKRYSQHLAQASQLNLVGLKKVFPLFALGVAIFTFAFLWNPSLIFQALFSDDFNAAAYKSARIAYGQSASSDSSAFLRIANTLRLSVFPLCTYIMFFVQNRNPKYKILFWGIFVAAFLVNLSSGQKAAALEVLIGLLLCKIFASGNLDVSISGKTGRILAIVISFLLLIVVPFQYRLQYPTLDYAECLQSVFNRLGAETSRTLQLHFYMYPDIFPHLLGGSSRVISSLLGDDRILDPARVIRGYIVFNDTADGTGSWNAAFIGAAWADFSYFGVMLESIIVAMLLWYYHQWFVKQPKTAGVLGTYIALSLGSAYLSEGNLLTTFLTCGLVLNFWVYRMFESMPKPKLINRLNLMSRLT